jgi:hypothetical protein
VRVEAQARLAYRDQGMLMLRTHLSPILAIIAGIAILIAPRLLNFIVAIYLIVFGILGLGILHF